jgi:hypothetical protein
MPGSRCKSLAPLPAADSIKESKVILFNYLLPNTKPGKKSFRKAANFAPLAAKAAGRPPRQNDPAQAGVKEHGLAGVMEKDCLPSFLSRSKFFFCQSWVFPVFVGES